jgi:NADH:ubiquinone reductase (non-electrogenic)
MKVALTAGSEEFPHLEEVINNIDAKFDQFAENNRISFDGFKAGPGKCRLPRHQHTC